MSFTPCCITSIAVTVPVSAMRNKWAKNAQDIGMREVLPRLYNLVTLSAFQAIDLIANIFIMLIKLPVAILKGSNIVHVKSLHFSFCAVQVHFKKIARNIVGLFGSIIGLVDPEFPNKFLCPISEASWKWAKSSLPLYKKWYDNAFYISLDCDKHREKELLPHLQTCQIKNLEKIRGVYGIDTEQLFNALVKLELVDSNARDKEAAVKPFWENAGWEINTGNANTSEKQKRAKLGCYLSHMLVLKKIIDNKIKRGLILEDDVRFSTQASSILESAHPLLPSDWDIFYFGYTVHEKKNPKKINTKINSPTNACGTFAFVIKDKAAKQLFNTALNHLKNVQSGKCKLRNIDRVLTDLQNNIDPTTQQKYQDTPLKFYALQTKIAEVASYVSTIKGTRRYL